MLLHRAYGKLNELGSNALIAGTRLLTRRRLLRAPLQREPFLGTGRYRYRVDYDWCRADPARVPVKNAHEMVVDVQGRLYLLTDHPRNNVIVFGRDGEVLNTWTLGSTGAHGLTLARTGAEERLWICDPYRASVVQTTLDGTITRTLADPHRLGAYRYRMPYAPTQTAVAPNGDIYVADGYGSQHVLHFDADGKLIRVFGGKGNAVDRLDFAHGIAIDDRHGPGKETLLVTSRRQSCIKRFSLDGRYLGTIALPGGFPCRPVVHGGNLIVSLCWSGAHLRPNSGFIVILDQHDEICASLGGDAAFNEHGHLRELSPNYAAFHHVHDVCADRDDHLYVCQWNAGGIYPIRLVRADGTH